jgi:hypothetical protein
LDFFIIPIKNLLINRQPKLRLASVDGGIELLSTRPWFKSEVVSWNSREESNITATLVQMIIKINPQKTQETGFKYMMK